MYKSAIRASYLGGIQNQDLMRKSKQQNIAIEKQ